MTGVQTCALPICARWVWRRAFKGDVGTSWVVAGMFLQALIVAVSRLTYVDVYDALGMK